MSSATAFRLGLLQLLLAAVVVLAWWLPNRLQDPLEDQGGQARAELGQASKFNSLSYEGYRAGESPLTDHFPTAAEVDQDLGLLAPRTRAIRTYAAIEGTYDIAALAEKHGLKVWQGIWLGGDRAHNELEMAKAIDLAHRYPDTIERIVVGNEVLLRRDLPPAELIADIDHVRAAVKQKVAYADVSDFWDQFPEVAPHVDVVLVHLLPYWEDVPTSIDGAVAKVGEVYRHFTTLFPTKQVEIGEAGWPSRGRQRADAVPGRVNEARFLRGFIALSEREHFGYNFIEAFDQVWKYRNEGIPGANWGLFNADRTPKIPLHGPLREDPDWAWHAAFSILAGVILSAIGLATRDVANARSPATIIGAAALLGLALGMAQADVSPVLYDVHVRLAAAVNLSGQALLAGLMMLRLSGAIAPVPARTGADATVRVLGLLRLRHSSWAGLFEDICFLFAGTAAVLQILLVFDPRYRDFPIFAFAVPLAVAAMRIVSRDLPVGRIGREEVLVAATLIVGAVASLVQEGALNVQSIRWNLAVLLIVVPLLARRSFQARFFSVNA